LTRIIVELPNLPQQAILIPAGGVLLVSGGNDETNSGQSFTNGFTDAGQFWPVSQMRVCNRSEIPLAFFASCLRPKKQMSLTWHSLQIDRCLWMLGDGTLMQTAKERPCDRPLNGCIISLNEREVINPAFCLLFG
jgi:hypothetical protein